MYMYMYIYIERPSTLVSNDWFHASNPFVKLANAHASAHPQRLRCFFCTMLAGGPNFVGEIRISVGQLPMVSANISEETLDRWKSSTGGDCGERRDG